MSALQKIAAEEIDLEIALRQRLAATISDRITWAILLQESLSRGLEAGDSSSTDFRASTLEALAAIEAPSNMLLYREPFLLPTRRPQPEPRPVAQQELVSRSRRRGLRKSQLSYIPSKPKLLFIRHNTDEGPVLAKLQCPDCGRADFPNLQGCFNHCLLKHKRQYGSHDECIQHCAVVVPEEDRDWAVANGTEINGAHLPGLRRLFEIAVGGAESEDVRKRIDARIALPAVGQSEDDRDREASVHITRTLGLHKDTPSLALFLGKMPRERCVNAHNEDEEADIVGGASPLLGDGSTRHSWHKIYPHRNRARPELDIVPDEAHMEVDQPGQLSSQPSALPSAPGGSGSRFHMTARVIMTDRSLSIPVDRRPSGNPTHTHLWILSIDSPSYSLHISRFLAKVIISSVTEPPPSTLEKPITLTEPPFAVMSTTDRPFLARVKLEWAGAQNPPMDIEHWVELEEYKYQYQNPVLGDEQILDVELDRGTELLPLRENNTHLKWKGLGDLNTIDRDEDATNISRPSYIASLLSLLPEFPMTLKDVKGRSRPRVPYSLVANLEQLKSLIPGRRKAIEWSRARALQDAYRSAYEGREGYVHLTAGDVYCWLEDEGHFLRPPVCLDSKQDSTDEPNTTTVALQVFCHVCGFTASHHAQALSKMKQASNSVGCPLSAIRAVRMPVFDVRALLGRLTDTSGSMVKTPYSLSHTLLESTPISPVIMERFKALDLITVTDAAVTQSIYQLVSSRGFRLGRGDSTLSSGQAKLPLEQLGAAKREVEEKLSSAAVLALLVKPLVRQLLSNAVNSMKKQDEDNHTQGCRHGVGPLPREVRLLTPRHIVEGLGMGAPRGLAEDSTSLILGRLGESFLHI